MNVALVQAITELIRVIGVGNFFLGGFGFAIILMAKRAYNDRRKDEEINMALAEKDRTIQRLAKRDNV